MGINVAHDSPVKIQIARQVGGGGRREPGIKVNAVSPVVLVMLGNVLDEGRRDRGSLRALRKVRARGSETQAGRDEQGERKKVFHASTPFGSAAFFQSKCSACTLRKLLARAEGRDAPRTAAHFDPLQFLVRFYLDHRDIVRSAVG